MTVLKRCRFSPPAPGLSSTIYWGIPLKTCGLSKTEHPARRRGCAQGCHGGPVTSQGSSFVTDEYKPLLDRKRSVADAQPIIAVACPLLREVINHASWAFRRCDAASDEHAGENEDLAPFVLYRHLIELADSAEVLFASACANGAVPVVRAAFEASVSLDYILQTDYTRRSLAWTCAYLNDRIAMHERLDTRTAAGRAFGTVFSDELNGAELAAYDAAPRVSGLRKVLDREQFREVREEHRKWAKKLRRPPDWFQLVGETSRRTVARAVGRETEYLSFYGEWSGFSHAADAAPYIASSDRAGVVAFLGVRSPQQMPYRAFLVVSWLLRATRIMIDHFRPDESLAAWYQREVREPFHRLRQLNVVTDGED